MKLRDPSHEVTLLERNACDATFGWGVVLSDDALGNMERNDPKSTAAIRRALRLLGRHRRDPPRCANRVGRPRLRRHRPHADAADPAGSGPRAGRRPAVPDAVHDGRGPPPRLRPRRRLRRHQLARAPGVQRRVPPRRRHPPVQVHLARHAPEVRRRVHVHLRGDRARLDVDPRLPVRCRHGDGHRRVHAADLGRVGLRADDEGGDDRHVRARLRGASRWPRARCRMPATYAARRCG